MLQKRQKLLFQILYDSSKPVSGNQLAQRIHVTSRTIRSDIKLLNEVLEKFKLEIFSSKRDGYYIKEDEKVLFTKIFSTIVNEKENIKKLPNTPSERMNFIIFKLAFASDYIAMESLANMIFVSKTTVSYDVKRIIEIVEKYKDLVLFVSPIKGLKLIGTERGKRLLLTDLLSRGDMKNMLLLSQQYPYLYLGNEIDKESLFLFQIIVNMLNNFGHSLIDKDVKVLVNDVLISMKRIQLGYNIEQIDEDVDNKFVYSLKEDIEKYFNLEISEQELVYLQKRFNAKRLLGVSHENYTYAEETEVIVNTFLQKIKAEFGFDFSKNTIFRSNLILHISPMISRLKDHRFEENVLKDEIKKNYSFAFEISTLMIDIIKEKLNVIINESEVAYLALHVAAALEESYEKIQVAIICGSGLSMAQLVKQKLLSYFNSQINIIGQFSLYQINNIVKGKFGKVDLIISVLPLQLDEKIPIVQVSPLIMEEDLIKIKQYINNPLILTHRLEEKNFEQKFFCKELFEYFKEPIDYLDCLKKLTSKLHEKNIIDDEQKFYESVVQRESLYSTILDGLVAIPHPLESFAKTTVVAVGIMKHPVKYCGKKVKLVLLFAVNTKESEYLKVLFAMLEKILDSSEQLNNLINSKDYDEFILKLQ
jgi:lichenan operon transcriptional antiterminator